jgi:hypothetical protein
MATVLASRSFKFLLAPDEASDRAIVRGVRVAVEITNQVSDRIGDAKALFRAEVREIFSRIGNPRTTTAGIRKGNAPASRASASANALLSNPDF